MERMTGKGQHEVRTWSKIEGESMCSRLKYVEYKNQFKKESEGVEKKRAKTYKQPKQPNDVITSSSVVMWQRSNGFFLMLG